MPQKIFHTVIYLKISFHPYRPTLGRDEFFFSFFFQNTVRLFPKRLNTEKKKKTASNVLLRRTNIANKVYDVQTMQTKFAKFRQKSSVYYVGPPKDFDKSTRLLRKDKSIIVSKPDKGQGVANLNKCDYIAKMESILQDQTIFKPIKSDDNISKLSKFQGFLYRLKASKQLDDEIYHLIRPTAASTQCFMDSQNSTRTEYLCDQFWRLPEVLITKVLFG